MSYQQHLPPHPPARSRRLLEWVSRRLEIPELADDAVELFREKARRHGERAARRWYRKQTLAAIGHLLLPGRVALTATTTHVEADEHFGDDAMSRPRSRSRFALPGTSWLDVKLAARMFSKQPGLTLVAIFALAIGIPVGLLPLHVMDSLARPLPVEDAEQIVMVRNFDRASQSPVKRPLHDYAQWREELKSFESLGIWRTDLYNVSAEDGRTDPVQGAEVTASVLSILRVPPLLGRPLNVADEAIGAPAVVVIGYDLWQSRLGGDSRAIGRTIDVGAVPHTIVGVMPEGFLFPIRDHLLLPFRYDPRQHERDAGPSGTIIGRLANGVSLEEAQREIDFVGRRMAAQSPLTHAQLQPQVLPYTRALTGMDSPEAKAAVYGLQVLAFLLLAIACGNVGILILARTATRSAEIAVRTALGASRGRILWQLFIESLLLAVLGAGAGLLLLQAVATGPDYLSADLPFWVDFEVSLRTAVLAISLAVASAVIAGVVPALKATGRDVMASMQRASGGGGSGIRFGMGYSGLIVGEVAVALLFLVLGSSLLPTAVSKPGSVGIAADRYLYASVRIPQFDEAARPERSLEPAVGGRVAAAHVELLRRLAEEPGVGPVAIADALPGTSHPTRYIEVEGLPRPADAPAPAHLVSVARVDVGYFKALEQPILGGRDFSTADLGEDRSAIIVNTSFVERVLGGRNPIGRRARYWTPGQEPGPWTLEIVGVVGRLGMNTLIPEKDQGIYQAAAPGELHPVNLAARVGGDPERLIPRLRSIVSEIDGSALIRDAAALDKVPDADRRVLMLGTWLVMLIAGIAVVLAAACLYALMAFTVAERRRESAIRAALGARPASIVATIAKRAFVQLSVGVLIGGGMSAAILAFAGSLEGAIVRTPNWPLNVALIALFMIVVGMVACAGPTLRAIRIQPVEALKG